MSNNFDKNDQSKRDPMNWLREKLGLQPYKYGLCKPAIQNMNTFVASLLIMTGFTAFVWYELGQLFFPKSAYSTALMLAVAGLMFTIEKSFFQRDRDRDTFFKQGLRVGIALMLACFTFQSFALYVLHDDIESFKRSELITSAKDIAAKKWDAQIATEEQNLAAVIKTNAADRAAKQVEQIKELDAALTAADESNKTSLRLKTRSYDYDAMASAKKIDKETAKLREAAVKKKLDQAAELTTLDAGLKEKQTKAEETLKALRASKAEETRRVRDLDNKALEKNYGLLIKHGPIDDVETLYMDVPKQRKTAWAFIIGCFALVFTIDLIAFLITIYAPEEVQNYFSKAWQKAREDEVQALRNNILNAGAEVITAIAEWRKFVDAGISEMTTRPSLVEFEDALRCCWTNYVDGKVAALHIASINPNAELQKEATSVLKEFLEHNDFVENGLSYKDKPWIAHGITYESICDRWTPSNVRPLHESTTAYRASGDSPHKF